MKILIVDDELIIRNGILKKINRLFPNKHEVRLAGNVKEAVKIIREFEPVIVITDIKMPNEDGISLLYKINEIYPNIKTIVISGYQEFEYAKEAIKLNVEDYLVKPIENIKLKKIIEKTEARITEEIRLKELKRTMQKNQVYKRNKYLADLLYLGKSLESEDVQLVLKNIDVQFKYPAFTVITFEISNDTQIPNFPEKQDIKLVRFIIYNIAKEIFNKIGITVDFDDYNTYNQGTLIINHPSFISVENEGFQRCCNFFLKEVERCIGIVPNLGVGMIVDDIRYLYKSNIESKELLKIKNANNNIFFFKNRNMKEFAFFTIEEEDERQLSQYIRAGFYEHATQWVKKIFNQVNEIGISYNNLMMLYMHIMHILLNSVNDIVKLKVQNLYVFEFTSIDTMELYILEIIRQLHNKENVIFKNDGERVVESIKKYIDKNYYKDVSLFDLSNQYYMNGSYISQLFKQETGYCFKDYLINSRIEASKQLLKETQYKMNAISEMIGYKNVKYFFRIFKQETGVTPSQYRKQNIQKDI